MNVLQFKRNKLITKAQAFETLEKLKLLNIEIDYYNSLDYYQSDYCEQIYEKEQAEYKLILRQYEEQLMQNKSRLR